MLTDPSYWKVGHAQLQAHRFLGPLEPFFTTRADGTQWAKWQRTWKAANHYLDGLTAQGRGKTMQRMAFGVSIPEDQLERFVRESPWDYAKVQAWLKTSLPPTIRTPGAAFILDDVALLKQGKHSVGVYHQYAGASGKQDNCQIAVDLTYAVPGEQRNADQVTWPLGMQLYLPQEWVNGPAYAALRKEVGLPKDTVFRTKPQIALDMIDEARRAGLPHKVSVADAGYGDDGKFRKALRERGEAYILGVTPGHVRLIDAKAKLETSLRGKLRYVEGTRCESARHIAKRVKTWEKVVWGEGTKGKLSGLFWRTRVRVTHGGVKLRHVTDEEVWLLLEKRSNELKAYLCWGMDGASLKDLVAYAHLRWTIEQFHKEGKQVLGMDRFEGRTWVGWNHHFTMVLLAYAFLALIRVGGAGGPRPTVPQVARAIAVEKGTQTLMEEHGLPRRTAQEYSVSVLRRVVTDW